MSMSIALLVLFLVFMFLGVPIAVSLGAASVICMVTMSDLPLSMAAQSMFTSMNSFIMVAVPLFILCGSLMDEGGVAEKIYDLAEAMVGWIYGGLGHVSVVVNMLFAGMSGSSVAAIASIGKMSINALHRKGYPKEYATAINLSGSMLASVIPPSILMINAAATANVSIGQALLAGLIPGVIIGAVFMIYNFVYCKKHDITYEPYVLEEAFTTESGYQMMTQLIKSGDLPTAIVASSDPIAIGALRALNDNGIKVPEDISLMGFDDTSLSSFTSPPLTTIHAPAYDMGNFGANIVFNILKLHPATAMKIQLPCQLVKRQSCKELDF